MESSMIFAKAEPLCVSIVDKAVVKFALTAATDTLNSQNCMKMKVRSSRRALLRLKGRIITFEGLKVGTMTYSCRG